MPTPWASGTWRARYAGSRPYLGSGLLGSPENRYNLPHFRVHPGNPVYKSNLGAWAAAARLLVQKSALDRGLKAQTIDIADASGRPIPPSMFRSLLRAASKRMPC